MDNEILVKIFSSKINGIISDLDNLRVIDAGITLIMNDSQDIVNTQIRWYKLQSLIYDEEIKIEYNYKDSQIPTILRLTIEKPLRITFEIDIAPNSIYQELVQRISPKLANYVEMRYNVLKYYK
jgi:hypothetical protein